jgi:hypothetical protein
MSRRDGPPGDGAAGREPAADAGRHAAGGARDGARDGAASEALVGAEAEVRHTAREWRELLDGVAGALDEPAPAAAAWEPPATLRTRLLDAARRDPFRIVRAEEGIWRRLAGSAAEVKELYIDAALGARTRLVRVPAGAERATLTASDPAGALSAFAVDGELAVDGVVLAAGDFARLDGARAMVRSDGGGTLLVVEAPVAERRPAPTVVRAGAARWRTLAPGSEEWVIAADATALASAPSGPPASTDGDATEVALLRMAPGASLPAHQHVAVEELLLLHGDCLCQGVRLRRGDYHRAGPSSRHGVTTTDGGCSMIVVARPTRPGGR